MYTRTITQGEDTKFDDIQYATIQKMIRQKWPKRKKHPPQNSVSRSLRRITGAEAFKFLSATFLMVNILCMTLQHRYICSFMMHVCVRACMCVCVYA